MDIKTELHNLKTMVLNESHISDTAKEKIANRILEIEKRVAINYTHSCKSDSELLAEHKCKFYVNADWSYLKCGCGKRIKPSEG